MSSDWIVTVRVRIRNACDHDELEAEAIVRDLIDEGNGFGDMCDWPEDYVILNVKPGDKLI